MSSSNEQNQPKTPFQMVRSSLDDEHPADIAVASRLPQTELKQRIRGLTETIRKALKKRKGLWSSNANQK